MSHIEILKIPQSNWTINDIINNSIPKGWENIFKNSNNELTQISDVIKKDEDKYGPVYPSKCNIFASLDAVPLSKVRVIILGQDPYPSMLPDGKCKAIGRAFSIRKSDIDIPKSLINIYKEIESCIDGFNIPRHGDLSNWEKQGVLLLNSCLTYSPGRVKANQKNHFEYQIWMPFIIKVFNAIAIQNPYCIYLLWGREAEKLQKYIDPKSICMVTSHPSPLGVYKGFSGCGHFKKVNDILTSRGEKGIDWNLD